MVEGKVIDVTNYSFKIGIFKIGVGETYVIAKITDEELKKLENDCKRVNIFDPLIPMMQQTEQGISITGFIPYPMFRRKSNSAVDVDVKVTLLADDLKGYTFEVDEQIKSIYLDQLSSLTIPKGATVPPDVSM